MSVEPESTVRYEQPADNVARLDIDDLVDAIDLRLADLAAHPDGPHLPPPILRRSVR